MAEAAQNVMRNLPSGRAIGSLAVVLGITGGVGALLYNGLFTVEGGHRALKFSRISGVSEVVYTEGMHFIIPWFEWPIMYDVRAKPRNIPSLTGSKDLQMVNVTLRVLSRPNANKLADIYRNLGMDYDERVLPSVVNEVLKSVVAQFNASQLVTQRERVSRLIRERLVERAEQFDLIVEDVALTHLTFSPEFTRAVEAKQVAQQEAERAKYVVIGAQQEKQTIITKARGEAESATLIGTAVKKNPGFMKLRRIDAARDIADIVANSGNKVYLNADSLLLNLLGDADDKFEKGVGGPKKGFF